MIGSSPEVGSSLNNNSGSSASARAKPTRFFIPPLISSGLRSSKPVRPTICSFCLTISSIWSGDLSVCCKSGSATFSPTVRDASSAPDWNSIPKRSRTRSISRSLIPVTSSPKSFTDPEVGFMEPIMCRSKVLLPQPLPPMITSVSPRCTLKEISSSTARSPNFRTR